jgi:mono/diheme cytochrome c family protein
VCLLAFIALSLFTAFAQTSAFGQADSGKSVPKVKITPAPITSPSSGEQMYEAYCASCHGKDGKGNGPAAAAMKVPPTDLTTLAAKNHGEFPSAHVAAVIRGDSLAPAHGDKDMPVWGPVFLAMGQHHTADVQQRIANLVQYLKQIQTN